LLSDIATFLDWKIFACRSVAIKKEMMSLVPPLIGVLASSWYWAMSICECKYRQVPPQLITLRRVLQRIKYWRWDQSFQNIFLRSVICTNVFSV